MTIWLYTGTPGSGKSYHATADIYNKVNRKNRNTVISNYFLDFKNKTLKKRFKYMDNSEITTEFLINYAIKNHKLGLEAQTLLVLDEAQILFNSRSWQSDFGERMDWIKFFSQHRKLGYNIIMICQFDRMLDRQIRSLAEYEVAHMKVNNFFKFIPLTTFLAVNRWYGQKMKIGTDMIFYRKKIANLYNSFAMFDAAEVKKTFAAGYEAGVGSPPNGRR